MLYNTDDIRIKRLRPLVSPAIFLEEAPLSEAGAQLVASNREQAGRIISGDDDRLLVVVGPCSIHDVDAAIEYAGRLRKDIEAYKDDLQIVMRTYFEKPRTTIGWKGLINDPDIDESFQINKGLRLARTLLLKMAELGVPAGTEFLDVITPQYLADIVSWGAIGARTTESQVHRQLASGLSMPIGFKNGTGGSIKIAVDAIGAARYHHHFLSVTKFGTSAIVETSGNDACHLILRGSSRGPNYDAAHITEAVEALKQGDHTPTRLMVDCSHGNSGKDHTKQPLVAQDIADQLSGGENAIMGVMLESHLVAGKQKYDAKNAVYGQSITDACMDYETTQDVFNVLASAVRARRNA